MHCHSWVREGAEKLTVCCVQSYSLAVEEGPEQHAKESTLVDVLFGSVPSFFIVVKSI